jgi:hypothetical protein
MPKLVCPCGHVHNLSSIPDDGWITIRDRDFHHSESLHEDHANVLEAMYALARTMYECPNCGRLMWDVPGSNGQFKIYRPETTES